MRKLSTGIITGMLFLAACRSSRSPDDADIKQAINLYLQTHGDACTWIGQPFPVDIPESQIKSTFGVASKMTVLDQAGLVHSTDTVVAVPEIFGGSAQRRVQRYQPTEMGKQYLRTVQAGLGQSSGFCYGTKEVDSIVMKTDVPTTQLPPQEEVTYTYTIRDLAPWAQRADIQNQLDDIRTTITGTSKTKQVAGLELTNKGWVVPTH